MQARLTAGLVFPDFLRRGAFSSLHSRRGINVVCKNFRKGSGTCTAPSVHPWWPYTDHEVYDCNSDKKICLVVGQPSAVLSWSTVTRILWWRSCSSEISDMECSPDKSITCRNFVVKVDRHGSTYSLFTLFSNIQTLIVYCVHTLSYDWTSCPFLHKFRGKTYSFVHVCWFKKFSRDPSSNLIIVNTSEIASHNPIAHVSDLSKPLIHAFDEEEEDKVWILNAPHSLWCCNQTFSTYSRFSYQSIILKEAHLVCNMTSLPCSSKVTGVCGHAMCTCLCFYR